MYQPNSSFLQFVSIFLTFTIVVFGTGLLYKEFPLLCIPLRVEETTTALKDQIATTDLDLIPLKKEIYDLKTIKPLKVPDVNSDFLTGIDFEFKLDSDLVPGGSYMVYYILSSTHKIITNGSEFLSNEIVDKRYHGVVNKTITNGSYLLLYGYSPEKDTTRLYLQGVKFNIIN